MNCNLNFNEVVFKLNAEPWIIEELLREYSILKSQDKENIELYFKKEINFEDGIYYNESRTCFISDEYVGFNFKLRFNNNFILKINPKNKKIYVKLPDYFYKGFSLENFLRKWYDMSFLDVRKQVVRFVFENIIVPLMILFGGKSSPMHASSFSINDYSYLICGSGGVGKTGTLIKLSTMRRINFYSDDWAFINEDKINLNPTWPKIYAYNLAGEDELKRTILKDRPVLDRFQWYARKKVFGTVRRRINPKALFSIQNKPQKMDIVLYLVKTNEASFYSEHIDAENLAENMVKILESEYSSLFAHYSSLESLKENTNLKIKSKEEILSGIKMNYINFFSNSNNYKLYIPTDSKPEDIVNYLREQKIIMV